ncbi:MAG: ubiquitin family protein [Cuniculiplasma sp.]|jgi:sulfur carrier protein ThiS
MIRIKGRVMSSSTSLELASTVDEVMHVMKLSGERFISLLNGVPVTGDHVVNPSDDLLFLEVFSGG